MRLGNEKKKVSNNAKAKKATREELLERKNKQNNKARIIEQKAYTPVQPSVKIKAEVKTRKKSKRKMLFPVALAVLFMVILAVASVTVLFNITEISVKLPENCVYTEEQIINASGIKIGDNLYRINKFSAIEGIEKKLPYVKMAQITRSFPDAIEIKIEQTQAVACVELLDKFIVIDKNSKALKATDVAEDGLVVIKNVQIEAAESGSNIVYTSQSISNSINQIITQLEDTGFIDKVSIIDCEKLYDFVFVYDNTIDVHIGNTDDIDRKITLFAQIYNKKMSDDPLAANIPAVIDVSNIQQGRYYPK